MPTGVWHTEGSRCLTLHICASMWIILVKAKVKAAISDCQDQSSLRLTVNSRFLLPYDKSEEDVSIKREKEGVLPMRERVKQTETNME